MLSSCWTSGGGTILEGASWEVETVIIVYSRPIWVKLEVFEIKSRHVDHLFEDVAPVQNRLHQFVTMASNIFGRKLNPYRSLREPLGVKGVRQSVVIVSNPSSIDQNAQLLVRFPSLGTDDVIVPRTARLVLTIALDSEDANRTVVQNLCCAIVKEKKHY